MRLLACIALCVSSAAFAGEYRVDPNWPSLPEGVETGETAGVAVDSRGHVFVFHRGQEHSILMLDPADGKMVGSFGAGLFINAHGIAVDHDDNVWAVDTRRHQVMKFSHDGELLMSVGERETPGVSTTRFDQPTDVAIAPSGEFYVSDGYGNNRVVKFAADGSYLASWGEKGSAPGQFDLPHGITLDDEGNVYVADRSNQRVQVFTPDGEFLRAWGEDVFGAGSRPWGLEFHEGEIYVIDGGNMDANTPDYARVTVVDKKGKVQRAWSSYGAEPGQLSWGHDVTVGLDGSRLHRRSTQQQSCAKVQTLARCSCSYLPCPLREKRCVRSQASQTSSRASSLNTRNRACSRQRRPAR